MKMRVADYIAELLKENGITDVFSVVGGGAMHLNDAFGNSEGLHVTYTHHEQAAAIALPAMTRRLTIGSRLEGVMSNTSVVIESLRRG